MWIPPRVTICKSHKCSSYMSEEQAFFVLSMLCDRLVPGYYSTTMYGTLLDQRVFESLVEKTMPILWEHLVKSDVQLSVVSLPWFLSLYINSMPLVFAFRVLDVFFLEGPKVLFQIGLAILRINGEELLDATDDGAFISILKSYFSRLDESAHPRSDNEKLRSVTRFQELMVVAFKEFSEITASTILEERAKHKDAVMSSIESFAKRTQLRNLPADAKRLKPDELSAVYDRYHATIYTRQLRLQQLAEEVERHARKLAASSGASIKSTASFPISTRAAVTGMDYDTFREFLATMTTWAATGPSISNSPPQQGQQRNLTPSSPPADHDFLTRLFTRWDTDLSSSLSLSNIVVGLADIVGRRKDLMHNITYWFELYDTDGDGRVDREGILKVSEALLFVTRRGPEEERVLGAVSGFIRRCFEYADPDNERSAPLIPVESPKEVANVALNPSAPLSITLPTFRMVILADEVLESFFDSGFAESFHLLSAPSLPIEAAAEVRSAAGYLPTAKGIRGVLDGLVDEATRVANEVRRRIEDVEDGEEEEEGEDGGAAGRERDEEVLKGAEAEVGVPMAGEGRLEEGADEGRLVVGKGPGRGMGTRSVSVGSGGVDGGGRGLVEFETAGVGS
jgi:hypothetical protein